MIEAADNFTAADVMELADMQDLGSCAARRAGSSPVIRIKPPERRFRGFLRAFLFLFPFNTVEYFQYSFCLRYQMCLNTC